MTSTGADWPSFFLGHLRGTVDRMDDEMLEPASAAYTDWGGSAAAENSVIIGSGDLYELAGLNHDEWSILAIDVHAFSHGKDPRWSVDIYALDRDLHGIASFEDLKRLDGERGGLPVTEVRLHDVSLDDVVRCMKYVHFQLIHPDFGRLRITDRTDYPAQD